MAEGNKNVLLAVDGSDESLAVVRYVSESLHPTGSEVLVYQVMSKVPEVFWDLGKDPAWLPKIEAVREYEQKQEGFAASFMNKAVEMFKAAGFKPGSVATRIGVQQEGIARDIVAEAKRGGYNVLVIGRGKSGSAQDMPLGGVASKILSAAPAPAVWLVGGKPSSDNILIAMDSSENAIQAVKHAGKMFKHGKNNITLFHAVRGISVSMEGMEDIFPDSYRKRLLEDAEREIRPALKLAELWLAKMDIAPERISTKIVTGVSSRAAAVVEEAKQGAYGTIVAGRRGISEVADFSMGRVTNKLTQLAKEQALCIVG
ncbi:MAG: universal stress protein [Desulfoprunum sp.]|nr:universal stress protein [Desulfoprunum sp.]